MKHAQTSKEKEVMRAAQRGECRQRVRQWMQEKLECTVESVEQILSGSKEGEGEDRDNEMWDVLEKWKLVDKEEADKVEGAIRRVEYKVHIEEEQKRE